ncbi:MAG: pilin [Gammaproteobacteria bacterium]|nr:pilin [Gammaproteobacteria bacterium]
MDKNTYQVIITNKLSDYQDKGLVIKKLAVLFKINEKKAEQLISKTATIIKKNTDEDTAKKFMASILITGAECKIINISEETHSLEAKEHLQLDDINDSDEKILCPECGSVKQLHSDECLFCGFNQETSEKKNYNILKYASIMTILATIFIVIGYQFALPYYNLYASNSRIEKGMELAFETRNTVTTFILETNFWPNQNIDANLDKNISNEIIESIVLSKNAVITVTLRAEPLSEDSTKTIIFSPNVLKGKLVWNCQKGTLKNELRPDICKTINL